MENSEMTLFTKINKQTNRKTKAKQNKNENTLAESATKLDIGLFHGSL